MMVQMEEIVDCSLNAEGMLGDSSTTGQQQSNNGRNTMLKLILSDGYYTSSNNNNSTMVAMITSPNIPNLSTKTPPGTKLLLFSQLTIRHGLLQLSSSNVLVLGGRIEKWESYAKETKERIRKRKGCGVDATVRALVWVNDLVDGMCFFYLNYIVVELMFCL